MPIAQFLLLGTLHNSITSRGFNCAASLQLERHIADWQGHIARQHKLVERLRSNGGDFSVPERASASCQPTSRAALRRSSAMRSTSATAYSSLSSARTRSISPRAFLSLSSSDIGDGLQHSTLACLLMVHQHRLRRGRSKDRKSRTYATRAVEGAL